MAIPLTVQAEAVADGDAEFEDGLGKDVPRGLKGREDNLPRTRWAEAEELGKE